MFSSFSEEDEDPGGGSMETQQTSRGLGKHPMNSPPESPNNSKTPKVLSSFEQGLKGKMFGGPKKQVVRDTPAPVPEDKPQTDAEMKEKIEITGRIRQYPTNHVGPYIVYIRAKDTQLSHIKIAAYLFKAYSTEIISCKEVSQYKLRVECKNIVVANELPKDKELSLFRVYVPSSEVECEGVISWPVDYEANKLVCDEVYGLHVGTNEKIKILDTFRLNAKREEENSSEKTFYPSTLVRITFQGKVLPNYVVIDCLRIVVRPFVKNPMFCTNCNEFKGHTSKFCNKKATCYKCGGYHATDICKNEEASSPCVTCKTIHVKELEKCPKYIKIFETKKLKIKAASKQSSKNIRKTEHKQSQNIFNALDEVEFPAVDDSNTYKNPSKSTSTKNQKSWAQLVMETTVKKERPRKSTKRGPVPGFQKVSDDPLANNIINWIDKLPIPEDWKEAIGTAIIPLIIKISPIITPLLNLLIINN